MTASLDGKITISVEECGNREQYLDTLRDLCRELASAQHKIQKREPQLARIAENIGPLDLAEALRSGGKVQSKDGETDLASLCDVTDNTQNVLVGIANDILFLNRLETADVPDVLQIMVRREGEEIYANLATGLSPGEQSAAILTLALQTRTMPLILDQPEDELGPEYVVNLTVPKVLKAKFSRQLLASNSQF